MFGEAGLPPGQQRKPGEKERSCEGCGWCCEVFAVSAPQPDSVTNLDCLVWILYHGVPLQYDPVDGYSILIEKRCGNLAEDGRCKVYANRPWLCREFSRKDCEVNAIGPTTKIIRDPAHLLAIQKRWRPRVFNTYKAKGYAPPELFEAVEELWRKRKSLRSSKI